MRKIQPLYMYATADCATATADGMPVNLREGEVWAGNDPVVLARPGLFCADPPGPRFPRRSVAVEGAL